MAETQQTNIGRSPDVVAALYDIFAPYESPGQGWCTFCWTPGEIEHIATTPVRQLDAEYGRKLLWEASDHWANANVYRHYLPRILELIGPPWCLEDLYPDHLFSVLLANGFAKWPGPEQLAVRQYLDERTPAILAKLHVDSRPEWLAGLKGLSGIADA